MEHPTVYVTSTAAKALGVDKRQVKRWCDAGNLSSYRIHTHQSRRIHFDAILKYAEAKSIQLVLSPECPSQFSTSSAARLLRVSKRMLRKLFDRDEIAGYRCPTHQSRRIDRSSLVRFVHENNIECPLKRETEHPDEFSGLGLS